MANRNEKRLREILDQLPETQVAELVEYAEFLLQKHGKKALPPRQDIPRPEGETVIKALKRLSATYPMLDRRKLLNDTSVLVGQHVMQGRGTVEVIDELEIIFLRHYESLKQRAEDDR